MWHFFDQDCWAPGKDFFNGDALEALQFLKKRQAVIQEFESVLKAFVCDRCDMDVLFMFSIALTNTPFVIRTLMQRKICCMKGKKPSLMWYGVISMCSRLLFVSLTIMCLSSANPSRLDVTYVRGTCEGCRGTVMFIMRKLALYVCVYVCDGLTL